MRLAAALCLVLLPGAAEARFLPLTLGEVQRIVEPCGAQLDTEPPIRIGQPPPRPFPRGTDGDYAAYVEADKSDAMRMFFALTLVGGRISRLEILWTDRAAFEACGLPLLERSFPGWSDLPRWLLAASAMKLPPQPKEHPSADRQAVQNGLALTVYGTNLAIYADEYDDGDEAREIEQGPHLVIPRGTSGPAKPPPGTTKRRKHDLMRP